MINTKSQSTCSLIGKRNVWVLGVCVFVCVCTRLEQSASYLLWRRYSFIKIFLIWICFWFSICSLVSASLISSWIFFFFLFKQLFETTTGILSIISWKFVVVCLRYNWLYTIVLTFQTALSTFILITHLLHWFFFLKCLLWKTQIPSMLNVKRKCVLFCKGTFKYCCKYLDRGCWTLKKN